MGVVYRAHDQRLGRDLAIKILQPGAFGDLDAQKRFRREAKILSRLNHPAVQIIHDFDQIEGHELLISEFVPGISLDKAISSGALPQDEILQIGIQLAQGLGAAHAQGILHRDLKPANLRLTPDGRLKILDFGLAAFSPQSLLATSNTLSVSDMPTGLAGTLPYMPPEQLLGEPVTERSDLYSAGITLYELATSRLPFRHELVTRLTNSIVHDSPLLPSKFNPTISPALENVILKCLQKDPAQRYSSAKELAEDLQRLQSAGISTSAQPSPSNYSRKTHKSLFVAAVLFTGVALFAVSIRFLRKNSSAPNAIPSLRWEQLTNFTDSAGAPALSPDGRLLAFVRGDTEFGGSVLAGQVWFKTLPDNPPVPLTKTPFRKHTLAFSPDSSRILFTQIEDQFTWNTYEVPLLGAQEPRQFLPNATGLSFIADNRILFSEIKHGLQMAIVTSDLSRTRERDIYVPADIASGIAHRSAISPDGRWVLTAEMDETGWLPCRLVPFDASSAGHAVGPTAPCTAAQWSPDGSSMYFTADFAGKGFHIWRQRFPDGPPQQLTGAGAVEEEGLAVAPDGNSLITAAGSRQSAIWIHDAHGDRPLTSEGYAFLPTFSRDGYTVYYLRKAGGLRSYISGELWKVDVSSGRTGQVLPGVTLAQYAISRDSSRLLFITADGESKPGIWIGYLDRTQAPRQLTSTGEFRAFFGPPGEIIFQSPKPPYKLLRIKEDGTGLREVPAEEIIHLLGVSPDGNWAIAGAALPNSHGDRNAIIKAYPIQGGTPVVLCDRCNVGFGPSRALAPPASWSSDGKWMYFPLRFYISHGSAGNPSDSAPPALNKTVALPVKPDSPPLDLLRSVTAESDVARLPGARFINEDNVFPGSSPSAYLFTRRSAKTDLFRIHLSQ